MSFAEIFPLVTFELQHPLVANVLLQKGTPGKDKIKHFFLVTVLISMYAQMHQTNEAVSSNGTAILSILEASVH